MPDLLLEIGLEELPPLAIDLLSKSLEHALVQGMTEANLVDAKADGAVRYASPRRLTVLVPNVATTQPDRTEQRLGPPIAAAIKDGKPTPAALGFAKRCGVDVKDLQTVDSPKGPRLGFTEHVRGEPAAALVPKLVALAVKQLPVPKPMRWGNGEHSFVRPVHWWVLMLGSQTIEAELFGVPAGNATHGHRVHGSETITLSSPQDYLHTLHANGVIADPDARRLAIVEQIEKLTAKTDMVAVVEPELLNEVTNLVEWPVALMGQFDAAFLEVPDELLIASMQVHQKCFPLRRDGKLANHFIAVANVDSTDPNVVRQGFERVIAPRLADAQFFWQRDLKTALQDHRSALDHVVFQRDLGSLGDKTERVARNAVWVAQAMMLDDTDAVARAAQLSRCDLMTETVGEFPELQGIAGRKLAHAQSESQSVATALDEFYAPRFSGDALPATSVGQALAIADKLDTLAGIFAVGLAPKGNKDPFALRRTALGVYRLLANNSSPIDLREALAFAAAGLPPQLQAGSELVAEITNFTWERARALLASDGVDRGIFDAVLAVEHRYPRDFEKRLDACRRFRSRPEATSLAAANKRISNILRKAADKELDDAGTTGGTLPTEELALVDAVDAVEAQVRSAVAEQDYDQALNTLSTLRPTVDAFFEAVMVMSDDPVERSRRLSLLARVRELFLQVADISLLDLEAEVSGG